MEEDRRLFARIEVNLSLKFLDQITGREGEGRTVNISANGVCFFTDVSLGPQTPLCIWLNIPDQHEPLYIQGKVVWAKSLKPGYKQSVGVYVEVSEDEWMGLNRVMRLAKNSL